MKKGKRQGSWEFYFPADNRDHAFWYKQDYNNDTQVGKQSDKIYDDGFYKATKADGTIIEANYAGGKQDGQYMIKHANGRIEKGLMY